MTAVRSHGAISTVDLSIGGTGLWERGAVQVHLGFSLLTFKVSVQTRYTFKVVL